MLFNQITKQQFNIQSMKTIITRCLVFTGVLIPIIFWISTFIAGAQNQGYDHFRDTISQLGAIGTTSEDFMSASTWITTFLSILFFAGILRACRQFKLNIWPLIGILGFTLMFGWAATFHSGNPMHSQSGALLLLLLAGPLLSVILWKDESLKNLRGISLVSFFLMLLILLRAIPSDFIRNNYTGLIQRFVHFGWSVWFVSLSLAFLRLENKRKKAN